MDKMQKTRRLILDYLKERGGATVDELAAVLKLTSVTVRHHLDILRSEELVAEPKIRHRSSPGRPQYEYILTEKASTEHFQKNYCDLAASVLDQVRATTPPEAINVFFEGVASRMAASARPPVPDEALTDRLDRAVAYLDSQGYMASWERIPEGYRLSTCNCPYEGLAEHNPELCGMDLSLVGQLLGTTPVCLSRVVEGASSCSYLVKDTAPIK